MVGARLRRPIRCGADGRGLPRRAALGIGRARLGSGAWGFAISENGAKAEGGHDVVLAGVHAPEIGGGPVVVAAQMQTAVYDVEHQFAAPVRVASRGPVPGDVGANDDLAIDGYRGVRNGGSAPSRARSEVASARVTRLNAWWWRRSLGAQVEGEHVGHGRVVHPSGMLRAHRVGIDHGNVQTPVANALGGEGSPHGEGEEAAGGAVGAGHGDGGLGGVGRGAARCACGAAGGGASRRRWAGFALRGHRESVPRGAVGVTARCEVVERRGRDESRQPASRYEGSWRGATGGELVGSEAAGGEVSGGEWMGGDDGVG